MFQLVELRDGLHTVRDLETGETFHPVVGPMVEAETVHLAPQSIGTRLKNDFTLWDVGLGAAANAVAVLEKLDSVRVPFECRMISFDRSLEPLRFALDHAESLVYPLRWRDELAVLAVSHETRIIFPGGGQLDWSLQLGDFTDLPNAPAPDGVIYDPYSPLKNPAMWSLAHFTGLRKRLTRPALLTSYSRSTAVRVTLLLAGFYVGIGNATGEKDQTTVAATDLDLVSNRLPIEWLARVRMSTSARPLGCEGIGGKGPIAAGDLRRLESHPQFS